MQKDKQKLIPLIFLGYILLGLLIYRFLGPIGDAKGPGWRDLLQGGFGLLWILLAGLGSFIIIIKRGHKSAS